MAVAVPADRDLGGAVGADDQDRGARDPPSEMQEEPGGAAVQPVQVVEDEDQGPPRRQGQQHAAVAVHQLILPQLGALGRRLARHHGDESRQPLRLPLDALPGAALERSGRDQRLDQLGTLLHEGRDRVRGQLPERPSVAPPEHADLSGGLDVPREQLEDLAEGVIGIAGAGQRVAAPRRDDHRLLALQGPRGELGRQGRLAAPRLAAHEEHPAPGGEGRGQALLELRELPVPADEDDLRGHLLRLLVEDGGQLRADRGGGRGRRRRPAPQHGQHLGDVLEPVARGLGETSGDDVGQPVGQVGIEGARIGDRLGAVLHGHRDRRVALEGRLPEGHAIEGRAQRVDVRPGVHLPPQDLLRRHVVRGSDHRAVAGDPGGGQRVGDTEVQNMGLVVAVDHDVLGLEVAVDHPQPVRFGQAAADAFGDRQQPLGGQASPAAQYLGQLPALDVLHGQVVGPVLLAQVEDPTDVAVGDLARQLDLVAEARQKALVGGPLRGDHLERHLLADLAVEDLVDDAHPPLAELADQLVAAEEDLAGRLDGLRLRHVGSAQRLLARLADRHVWRVASPAAGTQHLVLPQPDNPFVHWLVPRFYSAAASAPGAGVSRGDRAPQRRRPRPPDLSPRASASD